MFLLYLTVLRLIRTILVRKLISPPIQWTSITNRVPSLFDRFTAFRTVWPEMSENSYLRHFSAQVSQIVFLHLSFTAYYNCIEMSENSYLLHFSAQVSQIVFLAYLTVLRLFRIVWPEMSENSYLRHFSAQVSQIVFIAYLTVLRLYYNCMTWNVRKLISSPFQCTSITNRVPSLFDRFTAYYNCMTWNVRKLITPPFQCTSITNRLLSLFDYFTA